MRAGCWLLSPEDTRQQIKRIFELLDLLKLDLAQLIIRLSLNPLV